MKQPSHSIERRINLVYRVINHPLTIWGAERKLFFLALMMGAATFNFFGNLLTALAMFIVLLLGAQWATRTDPQVLRILLNSSRGKGAYDPMKYTLTEVWRSERGQAV